MASDNFGDHKNTGTSRMDGDLRAPLDMGKGSNKSVYAKCPKCKTVVVAKIKCRGVTCSNYKCRQWFDPSENITTDSKKNGPSSPHIPKLSSEYMKFRSTSEKQAESYARGSKKKFF